MRSLFIAALRLFLLLKIIEEILSLATYVVLQYSTGYGKWSMLELFLPTIGSVILYILVFWKSPWMTDRAKVGELEISSLSINAKTIVAAGLVLFGVYGIVNQLMQSLSFFSYMFNGMFSTTVDSYPSGGSISSAVFLIIRLLIYFYCIIGAGRIAELTTRSIDKPAEVSPS